MAALGHRGSFLGFTYNGIHSSTLGITRVGDGSRYNDGLLPAMKDVTTDIVGVDGVVYFGSTYTKRVFSVSFVFELMTDDDLTLIKKKWLDLGIHDLIFDEAPYKVYSAKITSNALIKHICFTKDGVDYFNGEGSFQFTCFSPYARSRYNWREDYTINNIPEWRDDEDFMAYITDPTVPPIHLDSIYKNYNDWIGVSKIPSSTEYGQYDTNTSQMRLYNAGDAEMPIEWYFLLPISDSTPFTVHINDNYGHTFNLVNLYNYAMSDPEGARDVYIKIDMKNHVVLGCDSEKNPTKHLYTLYVEGQYFLIPLGLCTLTITQQPANLKFNYLYL